jgi:hypothetical protein
VKILFCELLLLLCSLTGLLSSDVYAERTTKRPQDDVQALYGTSDRDRHLAAQRLLADGPGVIPILIPVICQRSKPNFDKAWPAAAKVLGALKAEAAAPCLVQLLGYGYPSIGPVVMKSDETLRNVSPAFAALELIGEPAVPVIRRNLPMLYPEDALMAVRLLRLIGTPSAKAAAEAYLVHLENQIRLAKELIRDFDKTPGAPHE